MAPNLHMSVNVLKQQCAARTYFCILTSRGLKLITPFLTRISSGPGAYFSTVLMTTGEPICSTTAALLDIVMRAKATKVMLFVAQIPTRRTGCKGVVDKARAPADFTSYLSLL